MLCLLAACQSVSASTPENRAAPTLAQSVTYTVQPTPTNTAAATKTTRPTFTPQPSATPSPTLLPGMAAYLPGAIDLPILMYHHVSDTVPASRYVVSSAAFRAQMKMLEEAGYRTITVSELANAVQSGGILPEKPVILTFDDAYLDVYEIAYPLLEEFGFTATVYVITSTLEPDRTYGYIKADQLAELAAAGWEIGSHSVTHSDLKKTKLGFEREVIESKAALEDVLKIKVRTFSYPFAVSSDWIRSQMSEFGYDSAVGIGGSNHHTASDVFYLGRQEVSRSTTLAEFRKLLAFRPAAVTSTPDP